MSKKNEYHGSVTVYFRTPDDFLKKKKRQTAAPELLIGKAARGHAALSRRDPLRRRFWSLEECHREC